MRFMVDEFELQPSTLTLSTSHSDLERLRVNGLVVQRGGIGAGM